MIYHLTSALKFSLVFLVLTTVTACGFHLRGSSLPATEFSSVYISSTRAHAPLARALKAQYKKYDSTVLKQASNNAPVIHLFPESLDRSLLSLFASGQVAEYELTYKVQLEILLPNREPQKLEFELNREYQDDPKAVLAKSRELNLILDEMREQAADRIIRRLNQLVSDADLS